MFQKLLYNLRVLAIQRFNDFTFLLLRSLLRVCNGFVTGATSISIPFYRECYGVTGRRGGWVYPPPTPTPLVKSDQIRPNPTKSDQLFFNRAPSCQSRAIAPSCTQLHQKFFGARSPVLTFQRFNGLTV